MRFYSLFFVVLTCLFPGSSFAWNRTQSGYVNGAIDRCLAHTSCKITADEGVWRNPEDSHGNGRSATSCHIKGRAIDIVNARCEDGSRGVAAMTKLAACLWYFPMINVCYRGSGACNADHMDHLHVGSKEWTGCNP
jgi:hypothetical protein